MAGGERRGRKKKSVRRGETRGGGGGAGSAMARARKKGKKTMANLSKSVNDQVAHARCVI